MGLILITVDCLRLDDAAYFTLPDAELLPCVSSAPITSVACASILTGCYPPTHGIRHLTGYSLLPTIETLATIFKTAGYRTHAVVSCPPLFSHTGLQVGFDQYDASGTVQTNGRRHLHEVLKSCPTLDEDKFFLWIHLFDIHPPLCPDPPSLEKMFKLRLHTVQCIAGAMATLVTKHPQHKFILTGDHAESYHVANEAYLVHGVYMDDSDLYVPLFFGRFQKQFFPWSVRHVDILPTVCREFKLPLPKYLDGQDIQAQSCEQWAYSESYLHRGKDPKPFYRKLRSIRKGLDLLVVGENVFCCRGTEKLPEMLERLAQFSSPQAVSNKPSKEILKQLEALGYL